MADDHGIPDAVRQSFPPKGELGYTTGQLFHSDN